MGFAALAVAAAAVAVVAAVAVGAAAETHSLVVARVADDATEEVPYWAGARHMGIPSSGHCALSCPPGRHESYCRWSAGSL